MAAHGSDEGSFTQPRDAHVRIVCVGESKALTVSERLDYTILRACANSTFGADLVSLAEVLGATAINKMGLCVFEGRHLPEFSLQEETSTDFRSGLYHLPVKYYRTYICDHNSKTNRGKFRQCGDREEIHFRNTRELNRLQLMAIHPGPRPRADTANTRSIVRRHSEERSQADDILAKHSEYFRNIVTTGSVVTPDPKSYTSFAGRERYISVRHCEGHRGTARPTSSSHTGDHDFCSCMPLRQLPIPTTRHTFT